MKLHVGASAVFAVSLLSSCAPAQPQFSGISWFGQPAQDEILAVSRAKLQSVAPSAYIFRVHIDGDRAGYYAAVYYRTGSGPAHHLVLRESHAHWRVTDAPSSIDRDLPPEYIETSDTSHAIGLTRRCS